MYSTRRTVCGALAAATTFLLTACQSGSMSSVPAQSAASIASRPAVASIDGRGKCSFGRIKVYNGPSGAGGSLQITSDSSGNVWYGADGLNAMVKFVRRHGPVAYPIPESNAKPEGVAEDPHRHVWFTEFNLPDIGRLTRRGRFSQFSLSPLGSSASEAVDLILGPDNRMWFTTDQFGIGAHALHGATTLYSIANNSEQPTKLAIGPDHNLWFTEFGGPNVGKMTKSGAVTEYNVGGGGNNYGISAGSDGRIWFTDSGNHRIGAVHTNGSGLTYYSVGAGSPSEIALRREDGMLYFTEWQGFIGQISPKGVVRLCAIPASSPTFVAFGITENKVDHSMWFTDNSGTGRLGELAIKSR